MSASRIIQRDGGYVSCRDITGHWSVVMASVVFVIGNCNGEQVQFLIMKWIKYFIQFGFLCPFDILVCYEKRTKDFSLTQEGSE